MSITDSEGTGLAPLDVSSRLPRLQARCDEVASGDPLDALVVTTPTNVRYLSGFTGSSGTLIVSGSRSFLVTDGRYGEQAPQELKASGVDSEVIIGSSMDTLVAETISAIGARRVGLEASSLSWGRQRKLAELLEGVELSATEGLVESVREIKDAGEIDRIRSAAHIVDQAFAEIRPIIVDGTTERQVAAELDAAMRRRGASDRSFETIVASGRRGALPHARPSDEPICEGDLVIIDCGAIVDGYCSDMTRTVPVGDIDSALRDILEVVIAAHDAGVGAVAAGVDAARVDAAARAVIAEAGWGDRFIHGTGHGVGLDIHESPRIAATSDATLAAGHVITVEPGVYLPEVGGARFEDTLAVTKRGSVSLTLTPQDLAPR